MNDDYKLPNKKIESITLSEDSELTFVFTDATNLSLKDKGQTCCEDRWMTCDDDLTAFVGSVLLGYEILEVFDDKDEDCDIKEEIFTRIITDKGCFRVCMHNKHNGCYSGFIPIFEEIR